MCRRKANERERGPGSCVGEWVRRKLVSRAIRSSISARETREVSIDLGVRGSGRESEQTYGSQQLALRRV